MELNGKTIKWLISTIIILLIANLFMSVFAYWNKGPSAKELIDEAIGEIQTAIVRIDSAKVEIKNVYDNLDTTKVKLVKLNTSIANIQRDYRIRSRAIQEQIRLSNQNIRSLELKLKEEQMNIDALKMELKKLQ